MDLYSEIHREQLSIEHSMRDLDSAVGRLDNIFMSLYTVIAFLIFAVAVETQFATLITGAGTFVLGLSWLIGASCQEILTSIIFLFVKHPYDVGDRVDIEKASYTVKEIRLLSTVFQDSNNCTVTAPNTLLTTKVRLVSSLLYLWHFDGLNERSSSYKTSGEVPKCLKALSSM